MNRVLQILVVLAAIGFVVTGVRWLVVPAGVAPMFGLTLADGVGLSSQVGDMSAFFLTLGICMLVALVSGRRVWFYPPIILLSLTALGRVLAWLVHDAALAVDLIAPEVIVAALLLVASRRLPEQD
jgi:hypothetical protein